MYLSYIAQTLGIFMYVLHYSHASLKLHYKVYQGQMLLTLYYFCYYYYITIIIIMYIILVVLVYGLYTCACTT